MAGAGCARAAPVSSAPLPPPMPLPLPPSPAASAAAPKRNREGALLPPPDHVGDQHMPGRLPPMAQIARDEPDNPDSDH